VVTNVRCISALLILGGLLLLFQNSTSNAGFILVLIGLGGFSYHHTSGSDEQ